MVRKYDALDSSFNAVILNYNKELTRLSKKYSSTFCGSVIANNAVLPSRYMNLEWRSSYDNDNSFLHQHYFDFINFEDSRILNSPHFRKALDAYLKNYTFQDNNGLQYFIDILFSKPMSNEVRHFLSGLYLQTFTSANNEEMVKYLLEKDGTICNEDNTPSLMKALALLKQGSSAPEIALNDLNGKPYKLSEVCKNKKFTVLVFYSPECMHCIDFLNELHKYYSANESRFNVFSITSTNINEVIEFNRKHDFHWINIAADAGDSSAKTAYANYAVIGTPTVVIIDNKMKIVTRFGDIHKIKQLSDQ